MRGELDLTRAPQALPPHADPHGRRSCAARNTFARRYGHRVSAGLGPPAGRYARLPAWWGRDHWTTYTVPLAIATRRDWCREEHVDPDTVKRVARAMAGYANHATGRECRPTNERLAEQLAMSVRQIQRARRLLKRLGLVVEVVRGRAFLSRSERMAAWRRGSSHRQLAAEFALIAPRRPQPPGAPVERVTPPGYAVGVLDSHLGGGSSGGKDRRMRATPSPAHNQRPPNRRPARESLDQARARRLIAGVQARIGWLSGVSPRRLTPLHKFARQGWTPRDVHRALDEVLKARGWSVPDQIEHPAAYLAALLRNVDPNDRPGALEEAMLAEERARREWLWQTKFGDRECEHGTLAGDVPHPVDGHLACPMCRRATAALA